MTLVECLKKHKLIQRETSSEAIMIIDGQDIPDLWHLADYYVSTVSCGNIWVVPMEVPKR